MSFSTPTRTCQETTPKKVRPLVLPLEEEETTSTISTRPLFFAEETFRTPTRGCDTAMARKVRPLVFPDEEIRPLVFHEEEETTPVSTPVLTSPTPSDLWDWPIRRAYTIYTLEDVTLQENIETLERWRELFTPSSQPRNEEEGFYVMMMQSMIESKLELLKYLS